MVKPETPGNHKGSILCFTDIHGNKVEDILLEPMNYQIAVAFDHGLMVLSAKQANDATVIDCDLWDESCEKRLNEIKKMFEKEWSV